MSIECIVLYVSFANTTILVFHNDYIKLEKGCAVRRLIWCGISFFAVKSKARLVKEGTLTMTVYGDDERFVWQKRIAQFRSAVRYINEHYSCI